MTGIFMLRVGAREACSEVKLDPFDHKTPCKICNVLQGVLLLLLADLDSNISRIGSNLTPAAGHGFGNIDSTRISLRDKYFIGK